MTTLVRQPLLLSSCHCGVDLPQGWNGLFESHAVFPITRDRIVLQVDALQIGETRQSLELLVAFDFVAPHLPWARNQRSSAHIGNGRECGSDMGRDRHRARGRTHKSSRSVNVSRFSICWILLCVTSNVSSCVCARKETRTPNPWCFRDIARKKKSLRSAGAGEGVSHQCFKPFQLFKPVVAQEELP